MSHKSVRQESPECPTRVSHKIFLQGSPTRGVLQVQECSARVPKSVPQESPTRVFRKSAPARVSDKSVLRECPRRVTYKSAPQECPTRLFCKTVPQECPASVSHKNVLQECPARVSHKSECHTRCPTRARKSVPQRFPKRMCPTRVPHKSVSYKSSKLVWVFVFESVFEFGFVGSILLVFRISHTY